jgi:hypothetical protein
MSRALRSARLPRAEHVATCHRHLQSTLGKVPRLAVPVALFFEGRASCRREAPQAVASLASELQISKLASFHLGL